MTRSYDHPRQSSGVDRSLNHSSLDDIDESELSFNDLEALLTLTAVDTTPKHQKLPSRAYGLEQALASSSRPVARTNTVGSSPRKTTPNSTRNSADRSEPRSAKLAKTVRATDNNTFSPVEKDVLPNTNIQARKAHAIPAATGASNETIGSPPTPSTATLHDSHSTTSSAAWPPPSKHELEKTSTQPTSTKPLPKRQKTAPRTPTSPSPRRRSLQQWLDTLEPAQASSSDVYKASDPSHSAISFPTSPSPSPSPATGKVITSSSRRVATSWTSAAPQPDPVDIIVEVLEIISQNWDESVRLDIYGTAKRALAYETLTEHAQFEVVPNWVPLPLTLTTGRAFLKALRYRDEHEAEESTLGRARNVAFLLVCYRLKDAQSIELTAPEGYVREGVMVHDSLASWWEVLDIFDEIKSALKLLSEERSRQDGAESRQPAGKEPVGKLPPLLPAVCNVIIRPSAAAYLDEWPSGLNDLSWLAKPSTLCLDFDTADSMFPALTPSEQYEQTSSIAAVDRFLNHSWPTIITVNFHKSSQQLPHLRRKVKHCVFYPVGTELSRLLESLTSGHRVVAKRDLMAFTDQCWAPTIVDEARRLYTRQKERNAEIAFRKELARLAAITGSDVPALPVTLSAAPCSWEINVMAPPNSIGELNSCLRKSVNVRVETVEEDLRDAERRFDYELRTLEETIGKERKSGVEANDQQHVQHARPTSGTSGSKIKRAKSLRTKAASTKPTSPLAVTPKTAARSTKESAPLLNVPFADARGRRGVGWIHIRDRDKSVLCCCGTRVVSSLQSFS